MLVVTRYISERILRKRMRKRRGGGGSESESA